MLSQNETTTVKFYTDFIPIVRQILFLYEVVLRETTSFCNRKVYISHCGIKSCGKMTEQEVFIDDKGRILIPKKAREKIGLLTGGKARLKVENKKIIIIPPISPEEFIQEMEGCIKEGPPAINPLDLKKIWDPKIQRPRK
jgi:AbrB family looped-hinge helix DNA binding protein